MRRIILVAALLLGIALSYFFVSGEKSSPAAPAASAQEPQVGALAPDFTLTDLHGESVSLSQYRGKVVMLNFWATWCPPCRAEMPSIEELYRQMQQKGNFVLLAVNVEDNPEQAIKAFTSKTPLSFPILLDRDQRVSDRYQVSGIPQTYIIDRNGHIAQKVTGGMDWNSPEVANYLTSLLKGE